MAHVLLDHPPQLSLGQAQRRPGPCWILERLNQLATVSLPLPLLKCYSPFLTPSLAVVYRPLTLLVLSADCWTHSLGLKGMELLEKNEMEYSPHVFNSSALLWISRSNPLPEVSPKDFKLTSDRLVPCTSDRM